MQSNTEDRYTRLASQVEYPEAWKPDEGDTIVGEVVNWEEVTLTGDDDKERSCQVMTLRTQEKDRAVWLWHTVLQNELIDKVDLGDFVAIHYLGRRKKQSGDGDYAAYRVAIDSAPKSGINVDTSDFVSQGELPDDF
jgi:hypothetical protein